MTDKLSGLKKADFLSIFEADKHYTKDHIKTALADKFSFQKHFFDFILQEHICAGNLVEDEGNPNDDTYYSLKVKQRKVAKAKKQYRYVAQSDEEGYVLEEADRTEVKLPEGWYGTESAAERALRALLKKQSADWVERQMQELNKPD